MTRSVATRPPELASARSSERRAFLGGVAATAGLVALAVAGNTVRPLSRFAALAQRRPAEGPQGLPVNKTAGGAGVLKLARDPAYRLQVEGNVQRPLSLSLEELSALPQHEADLPIACVEGWSRGARWRGVRVGDLLALAGADDADADVLVESLQRSGRYRRSTLNSSHVRDLQTLLALELNGERLHLDHGYPVRLIAPNLPGVLQTKWVERLVIL